MKDKDTNKWLAEAAYTEAEGSLEMPHTSYALHRMLEEMFLRPARKRRLIKKQNSFVHRTNEGFVFHLDPREYVDRAIFVEDIYERRFLHFLRGRFPEGAVALDVGANIGNHSIYLSGDFSLIHCFEPNAETFRRLTRNIEANGLAHVKAHQVALGERDELLAFRENLDGNLGNSGFMGDEKPVERCRIKPIQVHQGDVVVDDLGLSRLDFIKIDVEGFEPAVLRGLRSTISRYRPILAFEFHGQHSENKAFLEIGTCLPGYLFCELVFAPASASPLAKLRWQLKHGEEPVLRQIREPEPRSYENILAFPDHQLLRQFEKPGGRATRSGTPIW